MLDKSYDNYKMFKHYQLTNSETVATLQKNDKLKYHNSHGRSFTYKKQVPGRNVIFH